MVACYDGDSNFLHEPRALWSVGRVQAPAADTSQLAGRVEINKDHFRNTTHYPMTLTHALVSAINYTYREFPSRDPAQDLTDIHNSESIQNLVKVFVSAPYSRHITGRDIQLGALPAKGRGLPAMQFLGSGYKSSLYGLTRWTFDRPLWLPWKSTLQFDLSAITIPDIGFDLSNDPPDIRAVIGFDEQTTGMYGGNNRVTDRLPVELLDSNVLENAPFQPDAFGAAANGTARKGYPTGTQFPPVSFNRQSTDRGQEATQFSGFSVMIDQIDYDEFIQTLGFGSRFVGPPIAPIANRIATRAKTRSGGSDEWWWRPGAPLSLVCPTITPAIVYPLPQIVTLEPGEQMDVELEVPVGFQAGAVPPDNPGFLAQPNYQVGVSFTGYATIEG